MTNIFKHFSLIFDRSFSNGLVKQISWLVCLMLIIFVILLGISYIPGFYVSGGGINARISDIIMLLISSETDSEAVLKPLAICGAIASMIIFSGMLISVISNVLERRIDSYTKGETNYNISNHIAVLGFNRGIPSLIKTINKEYPDSFIALMCKEDTSTVRNWIHANISPELEKMVIVMSGARNAVDDLNRLHLQNNVKEIFVLGEENEDSHDSINMACIKMIAEMDVLPTDNKVKCHVQFNSSTMFSLLQTIEIPGIQEKMIFAPFNFNDIWAQKVLATVPIGNEYKPLDGDGIMQDSDKHVHLIICGMNEMGISLAINAAHVLHFPNYKEGDFSTCTHITFVDPEANKKGEEFRARYNSLFALSRWRNADGTDCNSDVNWHDPIADDDSISPFKHLGPVNFIDIQWEFIESEIADIDIMTYLESCATNGHELTTIALCYDDSEKNTKTCLSFSDIIRTNVFQILVRQSESNVEINTLKKRVGFDRIAPFGMMNECYNENLMSDKYGKLINACYCGCNIDGSENDNRKIEECWSGCGIIDKWSSIYCANMLFTKLRFLGLGNEATRDEIEAAVSDKRNQDIIQRTEHNRWDVERLLLGFRPLYMREVDEWMKIETKAERKADKKVQKSLMKHIDICSNERLAVVDEAAVAFDNYVNDKLWLLLNIIKNS